MAWLDPGFYIELMCGRYASFRQAQDLADAFARAGYFQDVLFQAEALALPASYNIAPTTNISIVVDRPTTAQQAESLVTVTGEIPHLEEPQIVRQVQVARWGLVPSWAKDPSVGVRMINARQETLAQKPSFKSAFNQRRCIVVADGYYEWQAPTSPGGRKTPFFISPADGGLFAFAGLYEFWRPAPGPEQSGNQPWLVTATIITAAARGALGEVHDRRPVFLTPDHFDRWLDPQLPGAQVQDLLLVEPVATTQVAVSTAVNSVANNDPSLIIPDQATYPTQGALL